MTFSILGKTELWEMRLHRCMCQSSDTGGLVIMEVRNIGHSGMWHRMGLLDICQTSQWEVAGPSSSQWNLVECHNSPHSPQSCMHFLLLSSVCTETLCFALTFPHLWAHWEEDQILRPEIIAEMIVLSSAIRGTSEREPEVESRLNMSTVLSAPFLSVLKK